MSWKAYRAALGAAALGVAALAACAPRETALEETETAIVRARVVAAERVDAPREVELQGTVEAERTAALSTRVMAMVIAVRVRDGERVRRGQLLLDLDPQASRGQVSQARGALAQAQSALALAERNLERYRALRAADAASELELDMARMQHEQASGAVEQAEGAVAAASSVAADSRIVAPFAGRVQRRMVEVGDLAAPGRPLLMLESDGPRRLRLAVPESLVVESGLSEGDVVPVAVDTRPDLGQMTGRLVERSAGADPATHSYEVQLALPAEDLPTGAAGRARVAAGSEPRVLVPADALLQRGGVTLVALLDAEGRAATRLVTVGRTAADGRVEILSGLAGGESVLSGLEAAPPAGARVEPPR